MPGLAQNQIGNHPSRSRSVELNWTRLSKQSTQSTISFIPRLDAPLPFTDNLYFSLNRPFFTFFPFSPPPPKKRKYLNNWTQFWVAIGINLPSPCFVIHNFPGENEGKVEKKTRPWNIRQKTINKKKGREEREREGKTRKKK